MDRKAFFELVKANKFFARYAPGVRNYAHKLRGVDGNDKPIDLSDEDIKLIQAGAKKMAADMQKVKL